MFEIIKKTDTDKTINLYTCHWPKSHCYNYKCNILMHHHQNSQPGDKFVELDKKYLFRQRGHYYMAEVYLYLLHSVTEQIKGTLYSLSPQAAVNRPSLESIWQGSWSWHRVSSVRELVWHATTHTTLFCLSSRLKAGDLLKCSMLWPWVVREVSAVPV